MEKTKSTKREKFLFRLFLVVFTLLVFVVVRPTLYPMAAMPQQTCEGIEDWFTNRSFERDYNRMYYQYTNCNQGKEEAFAIKPPSALEDCDGLHYKESCDDFSTMIMCLAREYNQTCHLYGSDMAAVHGRGLFSASHIGIRCLIDDEWSYLF